METCDFEKEDGVCGKIPTIKVVIDNRERFLCRNHYEKERDRIYQKIKQETLKHLK